MAANKVVSKALREQVYAVVTKYNLRGYRICEIRDQLERELGVSVSEVQVHYYIKRLCAELRNQTLRDTLEAVNAKVRQLEDVRRHAWAAWDRSQSDKERETVETHEIEAEAVDQDAGPRDRAITRLKRIVMKEGRLPASEYLSIVLQTLKMESELLGLEAPKKLDARVTIWDALASGDAVQVTDLEAEIERQLALPAPAEPAPPPEVGWYEQIKPGE